MGDSDGFELGCKDGDTDGTLDGTLDGCEVGTDDGIALGDADGASITSTDDTTKSSVDEFIAAPIRSSAVKSLDSSRMVTVDSIRASTFKFSRRRPTPVHDTSLRIVTEISTDTPSSSSAEINVALIVSSTSVILTGHDTTTSDFAKVFTIATIEFDGTSLGA